MLTIKVEGNNLVITIAKNARPVASKTGKSLLVASTGGFATTDCVIDGKPVKLNITAIIGKD